MEEFGFFGFYDSHLVRETEGELIVQGAFVKAMMVRELEKRAFDVDGLQSVPSQSKPAAYNPIPPKLDLSSTSVLPPRPEAKRVEIRPNTTLLDIGQDIKHAVFEAQKTTLAGYRILDLNGIVIAGRTETGQSLSHVPEVKKALSGHYASVIRQRVSDNPSPPIYSISRGTGIRVFVAMPIDFKGKIVGAVYLSRTPSHFLREMYGQRWKIESGRPLHAGCYPVDRFFVHTNRQGSG